MKREFTPSEVSKLLDETVFDVYYWNEEDLKNNDVPADIVLKYPKDLNIDPVVFTDIFPNAKIIEQYDSEIPSVAIEFYGRVNCKVLEPEPNIEIESYPKRDVTMTELEYLIYQYLIETDTDKPEWLLNRDVRNRLDLERIEYDHSKVDELIQKCLNNIR